MWKLVRKELPGFQPFPDITLEATIGRPYQVGRIAEIRCPSAVVSRQHCELEFREDGWYIKDLKSLNGTYVNEDVLEPLKWHHIKDGDKIGLGSGDFPQPNDLEDGQELAHFFIFTFSNCSPPTPPTPLPAETATTSDNNRTKVIEVFDLSDDDDDVIPVPPSISCKTEEKKPLPSPPIPSTSKDIVHVNRKRKSPDSSSSSSINNTSTNNTAAAATTTTTNIPNKQRPGPKSWKESTDKKKVTTTTTDSRNEKEKDKTEKKKEKQNENEDKEKKKDKGDYKKISKPRSRTPSPSKLENNNNKNGPVPKRHRMVIPSDDEEDIDSDHDDDVKNKEEDRNNNQVIHANGTHSSKKKENLHSPAKKVHKRTILSSSEDEKSTASTSSSSSYSKQKKRIKLVKENYRPKIRSGSSGLEEDSVSVDLFPAVTLSSGGNEFEWDNVIQNRLSYSNRLRLEKELKRSIKRRYSLNINEKKKTVHSHEHTHEKNKTTMRKDSESSKINSKTPPTTKSTFKSNKSYSPAVNYHSKPTVVEKVKVKDKAVEVENTESDDNLSNYSNRYDDDDDTNNKMDVDNNNHDEDYNDFHHVVDEDQGRNGLFGVPLHKKEAQKKIIFIPEHHPPPPYRKRGMGGAKAGGSTNVPQNFNKKSSPPPPSFSTGDLKEDRKKRLQEIAAIEREKKLAAEQSAPHQVPKKATAKITKTTRSDRFLSDFLVSDEHAHPPQTSSSTPNLEELQKKMPLNIIDEMKKAAKTTNTIDSSHRKIPHVPTGNATMQQILKKGGSTSQPGTSKEYTSTTAKEKPSTSKKLTVEGNGKDAEISKTLDVDITEPYKDILSWNPKWLDVKTNFNNHSHQLRNELNSKLVRTVDVLRKKQSTKRSVKGKSFLKH